MYTVYIRTVYENMDIKIQISVIPTSWNNNEEIAHISSPRIS